MSQDQPVSFAKVLKDANQCILQQQTRIKADEEKIARQEQMLVDQSNSIQQAAITLHSQAERLTQLEAELNSLKNQLTEQETARGQAEAVCDRQGERITDLQATVARLTHTMAEQTESISVLTETRDTYRTQVPTDEDVNALEELTRLLPKPSTKVA